MKKIKCKICFEEHEVDSTGWVQMCLGYYPVFIMHLEAEDAKEMIKTMKMRT